MPYSTVSQFEKAMPSVKSMSPEQKAKALEIFNAMMKDNPDMDEGMAVATAMKQAKKMMAEEIEDKHDLAEDVWSAVSEQLQDGETTTIQILKAGKVHDRNITITPAMLADFVKNWKAGVYGTELQINLGHNRGGEAAGWIRDLQLNNDVLSANVEWTPLGMEKVKSKQYRYISSEFASSYPHYETGDKVKNVLIGAALTNIPAVKGMQSVEFSEILSLSDSITIKTMEKLQELHDALMAKDVISMKELSEFRTEAAKVEDDKVAGMLSELEAEAIKKEEALSEKKVEKQVDLSEYVPLSEHQKMVKEHTELREKVELKELSEKVRDDLCLSETKKTGFVNKPETISKVAKFMQELSEEQKAEFVAILSEVKTVDLTTRGGSEESSQVNLTEDDEKVREKAQEMSEKTGRPVHECMEEIYAKADQAQ